MSQNGNNKTTSPRENRIKEAEIPKSVLEDRTAKMSFVSAINCNIKSIVPPKRPELGTWVCRAHRATPSAHQGPKRELHNVPQKDSQNVRLLISVCDVNLKI